MIVNNVQPERDMVFNWIRRFQKALISGTKGTEK